MVLATLAEFPYIPTTHRLLFLLVTLALMGGPTFYIAIVGNQAGGGGSLALILGIAQFFISIVATLIMPSGRMFSEWVVSKPHLKLSRQVI